MLGSVPCLTATTHFLSELLLCFQETPGFPGMWETTALCYPSLETFCNKVALLLYRVQSAMFFSSQSLFSLEPQGSLCVERTLPEISLTKEPFLEHFLNSKPAFFNSNTSLQRSNGREITCAWLCHGKPVARSAGHCLPARQGPRIHAGSNSKPCRCYEQCFCRMWMNRHGFIFEMSDGRALCISFNVLFWYRGIKRLFQTALGNRLGVGHLLFLHEHCSVVLRITLPSCSVLGAGPHPSLTPINHPDSTYFRRPLALSSPS